MHEPKTQDPAERLPREISRLAFAALALNGMIGAGIFGLPSKAARLTGAFSPAMWVLCALVIATVMLSFARAASFFKGTGGPQLYARTAFGPLVGFQTGWLLYLGRATAVAANANLLTTYLAAMWPGASEGAAWALILTAICALFTTINILGVKQGVGSVLAITVAKLTPLGLFILLGLAHVGPATFAGAAPPAFGTVGETTLLLLYAFVGFEGALVPAGEGRDPRRDIPRAIFWSAGVTALIYVLVQVACVALLPDLAGSERPVADAARVVLGPAGAIVMTLAATVSILGNTASSMLTAPRMTYALALEGSLPRGLATVVEPFKTPAWSILLYGSLSLALALSGRFMGEAFLKLAAMSSLARILAYAVSIAALPGIERRMGAEAGAFRILGRWAVPAIAFALCIWLAAQATLDAALTMVGFMAVGSLLFAFARSSSRGRPLAREGGQV